MAKTIRRSWPALTSLGRSVATGVATIVLVCPLLFARTLWGQVPAPAPPVEVKKVRGKMVPEPAVEAAALKPAQDINIMVPQRVVGDVPIDPLVNQFRQQGRPSVRAELLFLRHVCSLDAEHLRPIARAADRVLTEVATKLAERQRNGRARVRRAAGQGAATPPEPALELRDALAAAFKRHLSEPQWTAYQTEAAKRDADRKQVGLDFLVDAIDRELLLSRRQADQLRAALNDHWDERWLFSLEYLFFGNQYFPMTLDRFVLPILNANQQKIWQTTQKMGISWGFGQMMVNILDDGDPLFDEIGLADAMDEAHEMVLQPVPRPAGPVQTFIIEAPVQKAGTRKAAVPRK